MKLTKFVFVIVVVACSSIALDAGAPQMEEGVQQFASLGDFQLQSGSVIRDFRVGYRTLGKLNAEKSNTILFPTWLGGTTEDLLQTTKSGGWLDSSRYFIVFIDAIGDGVTTSPSNSAAQPLMDFPKFTIRDMVETEHRFATDVLHVSHLHVVVGISMGGMQTFEWAVAYPDFMDLAVPIIGSPQSTAFDKLQWTCQIDALELDPNWNNGKPTGSLARGFTLENEIGAMNYTSPTERVRETLPQDFESFLVRERQGVHTDAGTAANHIRQREAIMTLDIPGEFRTTLAGAAKRVRAKLLVIVSPEDHLVNPTTAIAFAKAIDAPLVLLDSSCGHASPTCISVGPVVSQFLADPRSVHSETLHEAPGSSPEIN